MHLKQFLFLSRNYIFKLKYIFKNYYIFILEITYLNSDREEQLKFLSALITILLSKKNIENDTLREFPQAKNYVLKCCYRWMRLSLNKNFKPR